MVGIVSAALFCVCGGMFVCFGFFNACSNFLVWKGTAGVLNAGYTKYQEGTPMKGDVFHESKAKSLTNKIPDRG